MGKRRSGKKRGPSAEKKPSLSLADLPGDVIEKIVAGFDTRERCILFSSCKALWVLSKTHAPLVRHVEVKLSLEQAPSVSCWLAARKDLVERLKLKEEKSDSQGGEVHAAALALLKQSLAGGALHTLLWRIKSGALELTLGDLRLSNLRRLRLYHEGPHYGEGTLKFVADFSRLASLESLHISGTDTSIVFAPGCLPASLTSLLVTESPYKSIPKALTQAPQLRQLEMSVEGHAKRLGGLSRLTELNLNGPYDDQHMTSTCSWVASGLSQLTNLQSLQLHNLESLPNLEALTRMPGLTNLVLVASCTHMDHAPPQLSALTSLQSLEISCQGLPGAGGLKVVASLTQLTRLVLANVKGLERLPASLTRLTNLQVLSIWLASELDPGDLGVGRVGQLTSLRKLRLSECGLSSIPNSIWALPRLEVLDVSANRRDNPFTAQSSQRQPWVIPLPPPTQHLTALLIDFAQAAHNPDYLRALTSLQRLYLEDVLFHERGESSEESSGEESSDEESSEEESSEEEGGFGWAAGLGGFGGGGQGQELDEESSDESEGSEGEEGPWMPEGMIAGMEDFLQAMMARVQWGKDGSAEEDAKHIAPHHLEMLGAICSLPALVILDAENWEQLDRLFQAAAPRLGAARERLRANLAAAARARVSQWPPAESGEGLVEDPDLRDHSGM